jgi:ParB family transcriptional regulator, chromosome partitioning protein
LNIVLDPKRILVENLQSLTTGFIMAEEAQKSRLGRGLAALLGDATSDEAIFSEKARTQQKKVPIAFLRPNPRNPRKTFPVEELEELALSIKERGLIQPIVVRMVLNMTDTYEIIAGERRWRAAQRAGLHDVPVVLIEADDKTSLELAIIENIQRTDLNVIEEANGYDLLMREHAYAQNDLAQILGKSRSHLANILRLLKLPDSLKNLVMEGKLSAGHARALLSVKDPEAIALRIIKDGLSVREVEKLAQQENASPTESPPYSTKTSMKPISRDTDTIALETALEDVLGMRVTVLHQGKRGELRITYESLEQLDLLCRRLKDAMVA